MTSKPSKITELANLVTAQIPALFAEAEDQITAAINAVVEQSQEKEDGKAILNLPINVKWDMDGTSVVVSLGVNVRNKFEAVANMEDPKQPPLIPREEGEERMSMTISTQGESVTITGDDLKKAVDRLKKHAK